MDALGALRVKERLGAISQHELCDRTAALGFASDLRTYLLGRQDTACALHFPGICVYSAAGVGSSCHTSGSESNSLGLPSGISRNRRSGTPKGMQRINPNAKQPPSCMHRRKKISKSTTSSSSETSSISSTAANVAASCAVVPENYLLLLA